MFQWKWMTNDAALEIIEWEYEGEYSFYDIQDEVENLDDLLNPFKWNHYAAVYEGENLVGYFTFDPVSVDEIGIKVGLHPALTGQGKGQSFVELAVNTAVKWYDPKKLFVHIVAFNKRAIRVFEKIDFKKVNEFEKPTKGNYYSYVRMEKDTL